MKDLIIKGLTLFFTSLVKEDATKLKIARGYLQAVKTFRLLSLFLLGSGVCLIFLLTGLFLLHYTILVYAPWSISAKVIVTLSCAAVYISGAAAIFMYVFAEDQWLKIFNTDKVIKELTEGS